MVIPIVRSIYPPTCCRFRKLNELGAKLLPAQNRKK